MGVRERIERIEQALTAPRGVDPEVDLPILRHMLVATYPYYPDGWQTKRKWNAWIEEQVQLMASDFGE
jgi:hypothetical protein